MQSYFYKDTDSSVYPQEVPWEVEGGFAHVHDHALVQDFQFLCYNQTWISILMVYSPLHVFTTIIYLQFYVLNCSMLQLVGFEMPY